MSGEKNRFRLILKNKPVVCLGDWGRVLLSRRAGKCGDIFTSRRLQYVYCDVCLLFAFAVAFIVWWQKTLEYCFGVLLNLFLP